MAKALDADQFEKFSWRTLMFHFEIEIVAV